jgi:ABC-type iron transport system FetAB ATPase subunit
MLQINDPKNIIQALSCNDLTTYELKNIIKSSNIEERDTDNPIATALIDILYIKKLIDNNENFEYWNQKENDQKTSIIEEYIHKIKYDIEVLWQILKIVSKEDYRIELIVKRLYENLEEGSKNTNSINKVIYNLFQIIPIKQILNNRIENEYIIKFIHQNFNNETFNKICEIILENDSNLLNQISDEYARIIIKNEHENYIVLDRSEANMKFYVNSNNEYNIEFIKGSIDACPANIKYINKNYLKNSEFLDFIVKNHNYLNNYVYENTTTTDNATFIEQKSTRSLIVDYLTNGYNSEAYKYIISNYKNNLEDKLDYKLFFKVYDEDFHDDNGNNIIILVLERDDLFYNLFGDDKEILLLDDSTSFNFNYISINLKQDPNFILNYIKKNNPEDVIKDSLFDINTILPWIINTRKNDKNKFIEINDYCINNKKNYFSNLPEIEKYEIINDTKINNYQLLEKILLFQEGANLKYINNTENIDEILLTNAILKNPNNIAYLPVKHKILFNKEICKHAVDHNGLLLEYFCDELKNDSEIGLIAVKSTGDALEFLSESLKNNKEIMLKAVVGNIDGLNYKNKLCKKWIKDEELLKIFNAIINVTGKRNMIS